MMNLRKLGLSVSIATGLVAQAPGKDYPKLGSRIASQMSISIGTCPGALAPGQDYPKLGSRIASQMTTVKHPQTMSSMTIGKRPPRATVGWYVRGGCRRTKRMQCEDLWSQYCRCASSCGIASNFISAADCGCSTSSVNSPTYHGGSNRRPLLWNEHDSTTTDWPGKPTELNDPVVDGDQQPAVEFSVIDAQATPLSELDVATELLVAPTEELDAPTDELVEPSDVIAEPSEDRDEPSEEFLDSWLELDELSEEVAEPSEELTD